MDVTARYPRLPARLSGFSVIELMVTLAVAMLLISTAVPAWKNLVNSNAVISARTQLAGNIQLARETAVEQTQHLTLCPSADLQQCSGNYTAWETGIILFIDRDADRQRDAGEPLVRAMQGLTHVTIQSSSGRRSIRFAPDGSAWGSNLTLRFCTPDDTSRNRAIILYGSGRMRYSQRLSNGNPVTCL